MIISQHFEVEMLQIIALPLVLTWCVERDSYKSTERGFKKEEMENIVIITCGYLWEESLLTV